MVSDHDFSAATGSILKRGGGKRFIPTPMEPAELVVCKMASDLLRTARHYEPGIIEDVDPEFVHQYRVNLRKCRSLIRLFKKSLSSPRYQFLSTELKLLANRTNGLRDLDVFLADENSYRGLLAENLRPGLRQIFQRTNRRRATALGKVISALSTESYRREVDRLLQNLEDPPEGIGKHSQGPINPLVRKKIHRQYQQICFDGNAIDAETPGDKLHELRIECKKLRYLLELFSALFAKNEIKPLIQQLKILQDNLGRFNDFSVQLELLTGFKRSRNISAEQLASIDGLTAELNKKQHQERGLVMGNLAKFSAREVKELFQQVFTESSRGETP